MKPAQQFTALAIGSLSALVALCVDGGLAAAAEDDGTLRGVARGADGPIAGADVAAGIIGWAPAAGDHVALAATYADGRFALARAPLGPIDVWVRPQGGKWQFAIRMSHPGVNDLDVDASPKPSFGGFGGFDEKGGATVSGVVTNRQGKAIAGAAVGLRGDDSTWVITDAKGQFTLTDASDGDGLVARADGYRDGVTEVKLGKQRTKMTVKLDPAKATVVHVTDPAGEPFAGAWVTLGDPDGVQSTTGFSALFPPRPRLVGAWTDANGDARRARTMHQASRLAGLSDRWLRWRPCETYRGRSAGAALPSARNPRPGQSALVRTPREST